MNPGAVIGGLLVLCAAWLFVSLAKQDAVRLAAPRRSSRWSLVGTVLAMLAVSAYVIVRALLGLEVTP